MGKSCTTLDWHGSIPDRPQNTADWSEIRVEELTMGDTEYFQGLLPFYNKGGYAGAIAALYSESVTQENASSLEQWASALGEVDHQAREMKGFVNDLAMLVHGKKKGSAA